MMDEWEKHKGGWFSLGALCRYSNPQKRMVTYAEWLKWIDGHCGYGIRPSERKKGYATKMLSMALPIMKNHGINPIVITCDKENIGSSKVILNNGGVLVNEIINERTGNLVHVYHIRL